VIFRRIAIVIHKEIVDNLRDRRSVANALLTVLINPLLYVLLFGFLNRTFTEQIERALPLHVLGAANAPNLVQFLNQNNVDILEAPADAEDAVRRGDLDIVLVIPEEFGEQFTRGEPARVQLLIDESSQSGNIAENRAQALIGQYSAQVGNLRLIARGLSPAITVAVPVEEVNVAPAFYLAVDTTAGERERKSLEPLLFNPVPRREFVIGKFLAVLAFTLVATLLATALFLVLLGIPQIQEFTAIRLNIGWDVILTAVALMIPVAFMAVALEMFVASFSRSVKEAQTYTQLVALFGFMPSIFLSVLPIRPQEWMYVVPTIGQLFLINDVSRGLPLDMTKVSIASGITLAIGAAALWGAMRLYNQERIILGNPTA